MKSVPNTLFFKPMKEEPHAGIRKSPFVPSGIEDGHGRELKPPYRPGEKCLDKSTGKVVTVLSYEPIRVEEVTEEDAIKMGAYWWHPVDDFIDQWHKRHPGKEWAWRVVSGITG